MHILGIVGGVASGKSLVAERFRQLGAEVLNADEVGHVVLREDPIKQAIRQRFGDGVFDEHGEVARKIIAQAVFANSDAGARALKDLEAIVHPRIGQRLRERITEIAREGKTKVVVLDAAVMLQAGWSDVCDRIIFVDVPREIRIERAKSRGWSAEELDARDARQTPLAEKRAAADVIFDNSGPPSHVAKQVDEFWASLEK
jgi:dephospho-CoA kinase